MSALRATATSNSASDHRLVVAIRRGDDRAFEELYSRYRRRISSYVHGMVADHGRAEDICQEVFISALRRMRNSERPIAFKPWIYEIAKNACIDEFRRTRRTEEVSIDGAETLERDRGKLVLAATPEAAAESKARLDDLCGAFGGLSETHHRVLVMREFEGLSYTMIGERLGLSRGVVESTLFRARKRLLEEYEELASGRRCARVREVVQAERERALQPLGVRERRRLSKHLAHCQPCRRFACLAGFDDHVLEAPSVARRIAALLPIPWLRSRAADHDGDVSALSGSHPFALARGVESAARFVDSIGAAAAGAPLATAAAVLAVAGGGAAVSATAGGSSPPVSRAVQLTGAKALSSPSGASAAVTSVLAPAALPGLKAAFGAAALAPRKSSHGSSGAGSAVVAQGGAGAGQPAAPADARPGGSGSNPVVPAVPVPTVNPPTVSHPAPPALPPVSVPPAPPVSGLPPVPQPPSLPSVPPLPHVPSVTVPSVPGSLTHG